MSAEFVVGFDAECSCETDEEITAIIAIPIDVPNWAIVLKTAPARAWVLVGNESVITRLATVKITGRLIRHMYCGGIVENSDLPSTDKGTKSIAQKAHHHHDHEGLIIAISKGDMVHSAEDPTTR